MPTSGKEPTKGKAGACGMKDFGKPARLVLTLLFVVGNVNDGSFGGRKRFGLLSRDDDRAVLRLGFRNVGSLVEKADVRWREAVVAVATIHSIRSCCCFRRRIV